MTNAPDVTDIAIDRRLPIPIHKQISNGIRIIIASGAWPPHYRLDNEPESAQKLGVSRGTYRRAIETLETEGLLRQVRGRGTFVAQAGLEPSVISKLSTLSEYFEAVGEEVTTHVLMKKVTSAPKTVAALLSMPPSVAVFELQRVRSTPAGPVAFLKNFVRTDFAPNIQSVDFSQHSLFATLEGRYELNIHSARRTFSAEGASDEVAERLEVEPGSPVQYLEQITYLDNGLPIEYSDVWIRSSRMRVTSVMRRK